MNDKEKLLYHIVETADRCCKQQHDEYTKVIEEKMEAEMRLKREEVNDAQE